MKVCVETHHVPSFGEIPEGSLWADDSPYIEDESKFADVRDDTDDSPRTARAAVKKGR